MSTNEGSDDMKSFQGELEAEYQSQLRGKQEEGADGPNLMRQDSARVPDENMSSACRQSRTNVVGTSYFTPPRVEFL